MSNGNKVNIKRLCFTLLYFALAGVLIFIFRNDMFYFEVQKNSWNIYRFIWCFSAAALGFFVVALSYIRLSVSPWPGYAIHYPLQLLAISSLVFGGLHLFEATKGYLFYYFSFGLCYTLGYLVDSYWSFIKMVIKRSSK